MCNMKYSLNTASPTWMIHQAMCINLIGLYYLQPCSTITVAHTISTHPFMSSPKRVINKFMSNVPSKPTHQFDLSKRTDNYTELEWIKKIPMYHCGQNFQVSPTDSSESGHLVRPFLSLLEDTAVLGVLKLPIDKIKCTAHQIQTLNSS